MREPVEELRTQLRERGYLTHGIEQWFALDPWRSTTFWRELFVVSGKAAAFIALFAALPTTTITAIRNQPLGAAELAILVSLYAAAAFVTGFALVSILGLLLKLRPSFVIDTPPRLLTLSIVSAALLTVPLALWWWRFDSVEGAGELVIGSALLVAFLVVSSLVISAALLTFCLFELQRVPAIHQKPRTVPLAVAAAVLIGSLFFHAAAVDRGPRVRSPDQVVTAPSARRLAFLAIDGLTADLLRSHPGLSTAFSGAVPLPALEAASATERWATVGTGVPSALHGVRSVDGIRLAGSSQILQSISRMDVVLRRIAPALGLAVHQPLPPTIRRRSYVWEIVGARGVPSAAANWWTSESATAGALETIAPDEIFRAAGGDALSLDRRAAARIFATIERRRPQLVAVYLPSLDVVLNRQPLDNATRLTRSVEALGGVTTLASILVRRGYEVILLGMPGDSQPGAGVIASTLPLSRPRSALDVAPTILALLGFPASEEMPGTDLTGSAQRIPTYGERVPSDGAPPLDREYYENLKSLGYIR